MAAPMLASLSMNFRPKIGILCRLAGLNRWSSALPIRTAHSESSSQPSEQPQETEVADSHNESISVSDEPNPDLTNPYTKPHKKCIICQHGVEPDYKNVQLLSQFVSPFTGRIYGRHITGLCVPMQRRIARLIKQAQRNGFMPHMFKETVYLKDPKLYDPFSRVEQVPEDSKS